MPAVRLSSGRESLLVEDRPARIGIVEDRPAACEAGLFVDRPGGGMAIAGLENQTLEPFLARQRFDALDHHGPDPAAAMGRARIHAFDLADAIGMTLQRPTGDGLAAIASDEHGDRRLGGDGDRHHACGTSTCRTVATSCRRSKPSFSSPKPMRSLTMRSTGSLP